MNAMTDPFVPLAVESLVDDSATDTPCGIGARALAAAYPAVGQLQGFDPLEQPLVAQLPCAQGEVIAARTTVPLSKATVGRNVLVLFEGGNWRRPIIIGVLEAPMAQTAPPATRGVAVQADGERCVIEAEREVVLKCGDASITLTRAGKVLIRGRYILSRSTGCQKVQGASIELN
jgi:uncharacterized protein DUF6484